MDNASRRSRGRGTNSATRSPRTRRRTASSLHAATANGHSESVKLLLSRQASGGLCAPSLLDAVDDEGVTPLYVAARNGFIDIVELLLVQGAHVDFCDADGETPLYVAAYNGFLDVVVKLLNYGANVNMSDADGVTPLSVACGNGHLGIVQVLLERGANAEIGDTDGDTPLLVAAMNGFVGIVELLLQRTGEDVNVDQVNADGATALFIAAQNGFTEVMIPLLESGDADANLTDLHGVTPLCAASHSGHAAAVRVLLDHHADANIQDEDGQSALYFAASNGNASIVAMLLERGAKADVADNDGATSLFIACQNGYVDVIGILLEYNASVDIPDAGGDSALSVAAQHGFADAVKLLLDQDAVIDFRDADGATPLYIASQNGHLKVVDLLLQVGAEVDFADGEGATPLYAAAYNGHSDVVKALIAQGANVNFVADVGVTPLYAAAFNGYSRIVQMLLDQGVAVDFTTAVGVTALYIASQNGFADVVGTLLKEGANANRAVPSGATPLYIAAQNGHLDVVQKLLLGGASIDTADVDGATPLYICSQNGHSKVAEVLLDCGATVDSAAPDGATPLYIAAQSGNAGVVAILIQRGAQVDLLASNSATPLYIAARNGHIDAVTLLLKADADVNLVTSSQRTPLYAASRNGHSHIVELLIQRNANLEIGDEDGDSPLLVAALNGHVVIAKMLLEGHAHVDAANLEGITPLYVAAQHNHLSVVKLLLRHGARVNRTGVDGTTPLYAAAYYGHSDTLKFLLNEGAAVDFTGGVSSTPLYAAAYSGHSEAVRLLLDHGAEVNIVASNGNTPLSIACCNAQLNVAKILLERGAAVDLAKPGFPTPLCIVAQSGNTSIAAELIHRGANVNLAGPRRSSPLVVAAAFGHLGVVNLLVAAGAALNTRDVEGNAALISASKNGHIDIVEILLKQGALTDSRNKNKETPLLAAGIAGHFDVVEVLLRAGASSHARSASGETALISAARGGHVDTVLLLIEHGCFAAAKGAVETSLLPATLLTLRAYGQEMREFEKMWIKVIARLEEIHSYFEAEEPAQGVLQQFIMAIFRLIRLHQTCKNANAFTRFVLSTHISTSIQDFHTEIDHLMRRINRDQTIPGHAEFTKDDEILPETYLCDDVLSNLNGDKEKIEAISLLQHEMRAHSDKYNQEKLEMMKSCLGKLLSIAGVDVLPTPSWFVPRHEVSVEKSHAIWRNDGSCIYSGKWLNSTTLLCEYEIPDGSFYEDVDRWFQLSHPNVVKLYGAYHIHHPNFAIFENVASANLREFLAVAGNSRCVWQKLYEAALGLRYLHERSIVLGKILCESIWIGIDGLAKMNGFGLSSHSELLASGIVSARWEAPEVVRGESPSTESDVYSLGMCVIEAVTGNIPWGDESHEQVQSFVKWGFRPPHPANMSAAHWRLIQCMCVYDPGKRLKLVNVLEHLKYFAIQEYEKFRTQNASSSHQAERALTNAHGGIIPELCTSVEDFLQRLRVKCMVRRRSRDSVLYVHARLVDINKHLQEMHKLPTDIAVKKYCAMLLSFDAFLRTAVSEASLVQQARSEEVWLQGHVHHREIDELVEMLTITTPVGSIHDWQQKEARIAFRRLQRSDTDDSNHSQSNTDQHLEPAGAVKLLHFEPKYQTDKFKAPLNVGAFDRRIREPSQPPWFIALHELKYRREDYITSGSFGAVYHGQWLGTPVVVKLMGYEDDSESGLDLFLHELRVWYQLSHPHIIKLFGACHIGKRFFVCEFAPNGTLREYLHGAKCKNRGIIWQKLYEVGLGLQYLHEQNVVHNDLKCDNFLIGADEKAKITDFGLSCIPNTAEIRVDLKQQGAQQWKSPEYLQGERPTLASDVYSFGMCILEAVTGDAPWGSIADVVVRLHLRKGQLPRRPETLMTDDQWDLIEMMCAHDPTHRLKISSVVERLQEFAQQEEMSPVHFGAEIVLLSLKVDHCANLNVYRRDAREKQSEEPPVFPNFLELETLGNLQRTRDVVYANLDDDLNVGVWYPGNDDEGVALCLPLNSYFGWSQ
ncbi:Tkl protein kinase, partial [Globisporangium splendens]